MEKHVYNNYVSRYNKSKRKVDENWIHEIFLENADEKRIYVDSELSMESFEQIIDDNTVFEVGLSFNAFLGMLGVISSLKYDPPEKFSEESSMPKPELVTLLFQLCMINFLDFRKSINGFDLTELKSKNELELLRSRAPRTNPKLDMMKKQLRNATRKGTRSKFTNISETQKSMGD